MDPIGGVPRLDCSPTSAIAASIADIRAFGFTLIEEGYPSSVGCARSIRRSWARDHWAIGADTASLKDAKAYERRWQAHEHEQLPPRDGGDCLVVSGTLVPASGA